MASQLSLPGRWPRARTSPDATDRLRQLAQDKLQAAQEIRSVVVRYGDRYGIRPDEAGDVVWSYIDDLLADYFADKETELTTEIESGLCRRNPRLHKRWA